MPYADWTSPKFLQLSFNAMTKAFEHKIQWSLSLQSDLYNFAFEPTLNLA